MHRDLSNIVYSMTIRGWKMKLFSLLTFSLFLLLGCQSQMSESDVQNMILENNEFINTTLTEHHSDLSIRISDIENQINLLNLYNSSQPNVGYDLEGDIYYLEDEIYGLEDKIYELEDEIKSLEDDIYYLEDDIYDKDEIESHINCGYSTINGVLYREKCWHHEH